MNQSRNFLARTKRRLADERSLALFYGSMLLLLVSIGVLTFALVTLDDARDDANRTAVAQHPFPAGQTVRMGSASMKISRPTYEDGSGILKAPAGKHYLIVVWTVKNTSDKPIQVLPSTDTYIKDPAGHVTYLTPYQLKDPFHAGELLPGEQVTGQLSYLVPKNTPHNFYVDAIWSGGVLTFKL